MKFYRSLLQLICLLLIGWAPGSVAGSSDAPVKVSPMNVATIEASSIREMADHLTDGFAHALVREAIVAPSVSHPIPLLFFCIIPTIWVLINCAKLTRQQKNTYYFFAYFRQLFGHLIAINAP